MGFWDNAKEAAKDAVLVTGAVLSLGGAPAAAAADLAAGGDRADTPAVIATDNLNSYGGVNRDADADAASATINQSSDGPVAADDRPKE